jgi:hypothetical protein
LSTQAGDCEDALEAFAPPIKYNQTDKETTATESAKGMQCSLAPHRETLQFDSQQEYEVHYAKEHTNRCSECTKNFPTPRFLELHIEENHNALREALAARGEKTYGCFVEDCERKCSTPQKRRLHLIDKHLFPKTYNFRIVDQGIDKASSMLREGRRRRVSTTSDVHQIGRHRRHTSSQIQKLIRKGDGEDSDQQDREKVAQANATEEQPDKQPASNEIPRAAGTADSGADDLEAVTQSLSALRFVPASVLRRQSRPTK